MSASGVLVRSCRGGGVDGDVVEWNSVTLGARNFSRDDIAPDDVDITVKCCQKTTVISSDFTVDADAWTLTHPQYGLVRDFCIAPFVSNAGSSPYAVACLHDSNPIHAGRMAMLSVSVVCVVLTVAVMLFLRRVRNNFGKATFSSVACLLACYIQILVRSGLQDTNNYCPTKLGRYIFVLLYAYFFVSQFTWMTIMTFDVWRRFWKVCPNKSDACVFRIYCVFGWMVSFLVIFIAGFTIDHAALSSYTFVPIALMLVFCVVLFVLVGMTIRITKKHPDAVLLSGAQLVIAQKEFKLHLKLFFIVTVPWIFFNFLLNYVFLSNLVPEHWVCITEIALSFPGILLFIVIMCNNDTVNLMLDILSPRKKKKREKVVRVNDTIDEEPGSQQQTAEQDETTL